jgi:peptide/nickel transport system ATP-binding protein
MLLRVENLRTTVVTPYGEHAVVDDVTISVPAGSTVALVGESGCGKSVTALSILRLLPPGVRIAGGRVQFDGVDLPPLNEAQMRRIRGRRIAMIFQEPLTSLNPVLAAGEQIAEGLRIHGRLSRRRARARAVDALRQVGIPDATALARAYPHQLSGGMRQRVMIAMALVCEPALLIADEPTTALDVTVQAQILELLVELQRRSGMALLLITHDLGLVANYADAACVMYAGRIVEQAPVERLFASPMHPYTQALLKCTPRLAGDGGDDRSAAPRGGRLPFIPGEVPSATQRPAGCAFHPRCELGSHDQQCRTQAPALVALETAHQPAHGQPAPAKAGVHGSSIAEHLCACWKAGEPAARAERID